MTVSARPAKDPPVAANPSFVAMRTAASTDSDTAMAVRAGSHSEDADDLVTDWHVHDMHQVQYAFRGVVEVETATTHHLLPPEQAAWIPAGLAHRTTLRRVRSGAVFFDPSMVEGADARVRILAASPVIREMIVYSMRWPIDRPRSDPAADAFFAALAVVARDQLDHQPPLALPASDVPVIREVMSYTQQHLATVTIDDVCASVGLSERTLRRRFAAAAGMSWRQYRLESRVLRAMALLTEPGRTVLDTATTVGFESLSAFNRAFVRLAGETPTAYRRRAAG